MSTGEDQRSEEDRKLRNMMGHAIQVLEGQEYKKLILDGSQLGIMCRIGCVPQEARRFDHYYAVYAKSLRDRTTQFVAFVSTGACAVDTCWVVGVRDNEAKIAQPREPLPDLQIASLEDFLNRASGQLVERFFSFLPRRADVRPGSRSGNPSPQ